jgi:hypothetical protein
MANIVSVAANARLALDRLHEISKLLKDLHFQMTGFGIFGFVI